MRSWVHVLWIPFFPLRGKVLAFCDDCQATVPGKDLPPESARSVRKQLLSPLGALPLFAGSIMFSILLGFVVVEIEREEQMTDRYLTQPLAGDVYEVNFHKLFNDTRNRYRYGLLRLQAVQDHGLEFEVGNVSYSSTLGPRHSYDAGEHREPSYFGSEVITLDHAEIERLRDRHIIMSVLREASITDTTTER